PRAHRGRPGPTLAPRIARWRAVNPSGDQALAFAGSSSRSRPQTLDPSERGGFVRGKLVVGGAEPVGLLAVAFVQRPEGIRDHGPSMKGCPMPPRRSAMRSEPGRKPLNGWSGRGLTVAHRPRALLLIFLAAVVGGCGGGSEHEPAPVPTPIGRGPAFMPPPVGPLPPPAGKGLPGRARGGIRST